MERTFTTNPLILISNDTTGCLLDYEYIKNHYSLIAVDLSRQKELNADPKTIEKIEFIEQLKMMMVKMLMVHNPCLS